MNAYQKREAERNMLIKRRRQRAQEDRAFLADVLILRYELASDAAGAQQTLTFKAGWYLTRSGKRLSEAAVRRAITEIWARVHEKEIQTNDN